MAPVTQAQRHGRYSLHPHVPGLHACNSSSLHEIRAGLSAVLSWGHLCLDLQMRTKVSQASRASLPSAALQLFLDLLQIWGQENGNQLPLYAVSIKACVAGVYS